MLDERDSDRILNFVRAVHGRLPGEGEALLYEIAVSCVDGLSAERGEPPSLDVQQPLPFLLVERRREFGESLAELAHVVLRVHLSSTSFVCPVVRRVISPGRQLDCFSAREWSTWLLIDDSTSESNRYGDPPRLGHHGVVEDQPRFDRIDWHLFLNTRSSSAAGKIIQRIEKLIGADLETVSLTLYWKDPALIDARLRSEFGPTLNPAEATFAFMETVNRLTHGFQTSGPQRYEGGKVEFVLLSAGGFVEPGVKWMNASIRNFDLSRPPEFHSTDE